MGAFLPQETIRKKRDGGVLIAGEIQEFISGLTSGAVSEAQASAFAMAVFFKGLDAREQAALTQAMTRSGTVINWAEKGFRTGVVDKHSTGGVGDKVSLMLAPIVAACGAKVPMISGRGLGHTGGTMDKFSSIPGYDVEPGLEKLAEVVAENGCAIIGQTPDLAPADKRLYAIRDVTGTVESIHLITASILSKKLAAGLHGLVMDVKVGNGAFMDNLDDARALAKNLVKVAHEAGMPTIAVLTDMNQVLGTSAGNALEMLETIDYLNGTHRDERLHAVVIELAAQMLILGGQAKTVEEGREKALEALNNGTAAKKFSDMVVALGGPDDLLENPDKHLEKAPVIVPVPAPKSGTLLTCDTRAIGLAVVAMRGGRVKTDDDIDYAVGISDIVPLGVNITAGEPIAMVHARTKDQADMAVEMIQKAIEINNTTWAASPVIIETLHYEDI